MRALVVCPGRGSYSRDTLGSLRGTPSVRAADAYRSSVGRPTPTEMDAAPWSSRLHLAGENASILTFAATMQDADALREATHVSMCCVIGNSMGWYTALAVAGALPMRDALRLVETMGQYQVDNVVGGQLVYPLVDDAWRPVPSPELDDALREVPGLYVSIRLGGQVVLGGTAEALAEAQRRLPPRKAGERDAPFLLPLHSAFHTPLMAATAARARDALHDLDWRAPAVPMVDGRGAVLRPRHADPDAVRSWTLGAQVTEPYDFTAALRVALREYAPDAIILLGPGGNLGGAIGQTLAAEGWAGVRGRADFARIQGEAPLLLSMARDDQRRRALGT